MPVCQDVSLQHSHVWTNTQERHPLLFDAALGTPPPQHQRFAITIRSGSFHSPAEVFVEAPRSKQRICTVKVIAFCRTKFPYLPARRLDSQKAAMESTTQYAPYETQTMQD